MLTIYNGGGLFSLCFSFHLNYRVFFLVVDPSGAQKKVLEVAGELGLTISVAVAHEVHFETGNGTYFHPWEILSVLWVFNTV